MSVNSIKTIIFIFDNILRSFDIVPTILRIFFKIFFAVHEAHDVNWKCEKLLVCQKMRTALELAKLHMLVLD